MMKRTLLLAAALLGLSAPAVAAGETPVPPQLDWSFQGPFGKFDRAQLQRGFKVYREVCASCHSLSYIRFRNLAEPGGPQLSAAPARAPAAARAPRAPGQSVGSGRFGSRAEPGGPQFAEAQVRALAAEYKVQDGPNEA